MPRISNFEKNRAVENIQQKLCELYKECNDSKPEGIIKLPVSGSSRQYYRLTGKDCTMVGVYNEDQRENDAFVYMSGHFNSLGLKVPRVCAYNATEGIYLQDDLGNTTLFNLLDHKNIKEPISEAAIRVYLRVLDQLTVFQVIGSKGFDFSKSYPREAFDRRSMMWDLNYFKYFYLKLANIPFDEQRLEEDFEKLCDLLLMAKSDFFLYRDFQSRNIMVVDGEPWFIDFQGGRKGSLAYDVASLLYDAKANLGPNLREELLQHYIEALRSVSPEEAEKFESYYYPFVYIRIMQAMGAYGYRGLFEKKTHFLQSIPFAVKNLRWLLQNHPFEIELPMLSTVMHSITFESEPIAVVPNNLTVAITSFSFRKGYPADEGENGGGFVFDCRALPNPGRQPEYAELTGKDFPVASYLASLPEVVSFLSNVYQIVDASIQNYIKRDFTNLTINFGCTGGRHRSVFMAESLAQHIKLAFPVKITLTHKEFPENPIKKTK